ncbi:MAG: glycosyl hydrolase family 18 protein [Flavobacteriales bacterium]
MRSFFAFISAILLVGMASSIGHAQEHRSVHKSQQEYYESLGLQGTAAWDSLHGIQRMEARAARNCSLQKMVYGWHPYWMGSSYTNYQWDLLTHFSYFSFEVDPNTGYPSTTHNWLSSSAVDAAQSNGVKADLCVTLFSDHSTFFNSSTSRQNLIDTLIALVQARNANGVNIDFESVPSSQATAYNNFLVNLANQMHNQVPDSEVSVALFSVDWNNIFNISLLDQYLDHFIIMGYGYYYSGSSVAGPTAPLYNFGSGTRNLSRTVNQYLKEGASRSKLVLGLPYYGYQWETASDQIPENTTSSGSSKTYTTIRDNVSGHYSDANKGWHFDSRSQYFVFQDGGTWNQCFVDLARGLNERLDLIHRKGLAGMGIWALGYDDGYTALWDEIQQNLTECRTVPCTDTIYDMGGPDDPYYNDERYSYTIDPDASGRVELNFQSFDVEYGYDTLWIYDGADTTAPLIGAYTGTSGPGTILSSGEALTLAFASDGATTTPGWQAIWNCLPDTSSPTTSIGPLDQWVTGDFSITFSDSDNTNGSGLDRSFYRILQKEGNEWRGNEGAGFFRDGFEQASIHSDWSIDTGSWQTNNGTLHQTDESLSNTNIHASLDQALSDRYLYHWKARMTGSGANRRAGLHYFCDSAELANRGNSYFAWFRLDDDMIQLYKVVNNSWGSGPVHEVPYDFQDGQWYDFKVSFDRISGVTQIYVDDKLQATWKDPNPHNSGNAISFRSGNADLKVASIGVYRSRGPTVTARVGPGPTEAIRFQNQDPSDHGGRIASIVQDSAGNLSPIARDSIKVDTTAPSSGPLRDGTSDYDSDTTIDPGGTLHANWDSAQDPHSGIQHYRYAIGGSPGDSGVFGWSSAITDTSVTQSGLNLVSDSTYYFMLRTRNQAGLKSDLNSDGVLVLMTTSLQTRKVGRARVAPNPFRDRLEQKTEDRSGSPLRCKRKLPSHRPPSNRKKTPYPKDPAKRFFRDPFSLDPKEERSQKGL